MTIEQLEKANEIHKKLSALQDFLDEQSKHLGQDWSLNMGGIEIDLKDIPEIKTVIQNYTSDKITELEKQLEEL